MPDIIGCDTCHQDFLVNSKVKFYTTKANQEHHCTACGPPGNDFMLLTGNEIADKWMAERVAEARQASVASFATELVMPRSTEPLQEESDWEGWEHVCALTVAPVSPDSIDFVERYLNDVKYAGMLQPNQRLKFISADPRTATSVRLTLYLEQGTGDQRHIVAQMWASLGSTGSIIMQC